MTKLSPTFFIKSFPLISETKVFNGTGQLDFLASSGANHLLIPLALAYVLLVLSLISLVKEIRKS